MSLILSSYYKQLTLWKIFGGKERKQVSVLSRQNTIDLVFFFYVPWLGTQSRHERARLYLFRREYEISEIKKTRSKVGFKIKEENNCARGPGRKVAENACVGRDGL